MLCCALLVESRCVFMSGIFFVRLLASPPIDFPVSERVRLSISVPQVDERLVDGRLKTVSLWTRLDLRVLESSSSWVILRTSSSIVGGVRLSVRCGTIGLRVCFGVSSSYADRGPQAKLPRLPS